MSYTDVVRYLGPLAQLGYELQATDDAVVYGERPAWAVYYRAADSKLQVCWSAREGGIDFMLALPTVPNEFGLASRSKGWEFLLTLSKSDDGLRPPSLEASEQIWRDWLAERTPIAPSGGPEHEGVVGVPSPESGIGLSIDEI